MKLRHLLLLGALMGNSTACFGHVDTNVNISPEGMMDLIPAEFLPAQMKVAFAAPGKKQPLAEVTLRLGTNVTTLPACIVVLLPSRKMAQVSASGSWYHDESATLPFYLGVNFAAPQAAGAGRRQTHVAMLFNLRTAKIINIRKVITGPAKGRQRSAGLDLLQRWSSQELDAVFDPMHRREVR